MKCYYFFQILIQHWAKLDMNQTLVIRDSKFFSLLQKYGIIFEGTNIHRLFSKHELLSINILLTSDELITDKIAIGSLLAPD